MVSTTRPVREYASAWLLPGPPPVGEIDPPATAAMQAQLWAPAEFGKQPCRQGPELDCPPGGESRLSRITSVAAFAEVVPTVVVMATTSAAMVNLSVQRKKPADVILRILVERLAGGRVMPLSG